MLPTPTLAVDNPMKSSLNLATKISLSSGRLNCELLFETTIGVFSLGEYLRESPVLKP